jgi:hypothetical protein
MKDEQRPVHQLEHAEPTVIHDPNQDMTILARWLQTGMEQGSRFWLLLGGVVVALIAVAVISSGLSAGKSAQSEAWSELTQVKSVEDRLKIAEAHPKTAVAGWAMLISAQEEYETGINDLTTPGKSATAGARLAKALQIFQDVAKDAPKDSPEALSGLFGAARTLEARNELPEAIEQYRLVASRFPDSPEAKQALAYAKALQEPVNVTFYKELYDYKPPATPPSTGLGSPGSLFDGLPPDSPLRKLMPNMKVPDGLDAPPPSSLPIPPPVETPKPEAPKLEPPKADVPKAEPPKAEVPKAETPAAPAPPAIPAEPPKSVTPPK